MSDNVQLKFAKLRDGAKIPSKREEDAGYDVYACFDGEDIIIEPGKTVKVPCGVASVIPAGYYMQLEERSSTGEMGIKRSAGVIDSGFRGEWHAQIYNGSDRPVYITKKSDDRYEKDGRIVYPYNKAIVQAILHKVIPADVEEISAEELAQYKSERGTGERGSSGK